MVAAVSTLRLRPVRRVAVLGAGVMGAQLAAHFANVDVPVLLFDLSGDGQDPRAPARTAISKLAKTKPPALAEPGLAALIEACDYAHDLHRLGDCDLVIEAVAERLDIKRALYQQVVTELGEHAVLASNTSGLSISALAACLPEPLQPRFLGLHFFNPPRYMRLVEIIPHDRTDAGLVAELEAWLTVRFGKGVVHAADKPNFIANRVGLLALLLPMRHGERLRLPFDLVDGLSGPILGRPKTATYRTADMVGLDTMAHVIEATARALPADPWTSHFQVPEWTRVLLERGALGEKTRGGVYRKRDGEIEVFDPAAGDYAPRCGRVNEDLAGLLQAPGAVAELRARDDPQSEFVWSVLRDTWLYAAVVLPEIASGVREVDLAMRWGYGWTMGPFELAQKLGWREFVEAVEADLDAGRVEPTVPVPGWATATDAVYGADGAWSVSEGARRLPPQHAYGDRQLFPPRMFGEAEILAGRTLFETDAVRFWTLDDSVGILSFKTKLHTVSAAVIDGLHQALALAERDLAALVIWHPESPFSAGANLHEFIALLDAKDYTGAERAVWAFQQASLALRDSQVPTVAGINGLALGGGCEFIMHCDRAVASLDSYLGLVEVGVGLIPAGGGCKEFARRAALQARTSSGDPFPMLPPIFERTAMGKVAGSAREAKAWGLLAESDVLVAHPDEVLFVAISQARALADAGYFPPATLPIRVAGRDGRATLETMAVNLEAGGFATAHDRRVAGKVAWALCGGDVDPDCQVSEAWLLRQEREAFMDLALTEATQARIRHTLTTGKPLRN